MNKRGVSDLAIVMIVLAVAVGGFLISSTVDPGVTGYATNAKGGAVCGDGVIEGSETCDDGNTANYDGCNSNCQLSENGLCNDQIDNDGDGTIDLGDSECSKYVCSSGKVESWPVGGSGEGQFIGGSGGDELMWLDGPYGSCCGIDQCYGRTVGCVDDGYVLNDVAVCSSVVGQLFSGHGVGNYPSRWCKIGYELDVLTGDCVALPSPLVCGDGICNAGENSANCPSDCGNVTTAICGNGVIEGAEQCDDGNANNGDGCSSTCQLELTNTTIVNGCDLLNDTIKQRAIDLKNQNNENVSLSFPGNSTKRVTLGSLDSPFNITLIAATDTSATIRVNNEFGVDETKEVNEASSKIIGNLAVRVNSADESSNGALSVEISVGLDPIVLVEKEELFVDSYFIVPSPEGGSVWEVKTITNSTNGFDSDKVLIRNFWESSGLEFALTSEGQGGGDIGGKYYFITYHGAATDPSETRYMTLDFPQTSGDDIMSFESCI